MSVDDTLFGPLTTQPFITTTASPHAPIGGSGSGIIRYKDSLLVDINIRSRTKQTYLDLATEIMDYAVTDMPKLTDVRGQLQPPQGALNLIDVVGRYYDNFNEIWVSCPNHMTASRFLLTGRFGYVKASRLPTSSSGISIITWYSIDTDYGQLAAIDMGLLLYKPSDRWYRVFTNEADADKYYIS